MENGADNLANQFKNAINNLNQLTDEQIDQLEKILEDYE